MNYNCGMAYIVCLIGLPNGGFAQDVTLVDNQHFTVESGEVIKGVDGRENTVSGATVTIEADGVVAGFDAFELNDTSDVTIVVYGVIDSADDGVVGSIYNDPPGNTGSGDDAIVARRTTGLNVSIKSGGLVLADDEFINGTGAIKAVIVIDEGGRVYSEDHGMDDFGDDNYIEINGYLQVGGGYDAVDAGDGNTVVIGMTGEVISGDDGIWVGDKNIITVDGTLKTDGDDAIDAIADNNITIGATGQLLAIDNGIEAENGNNVRIFGRVVSSDHGIDLGSDTTAEVGNNSVVVLGSAIVEGSNAGVQFDNSANTLEIFGVVSSDNDAVAVLGGDNTITIRDGAILLGNLRSEAGQTGNTLRLDVGSAQSYVFGTTGDWKLQDLDDRAVVEGSAMAAGIANVETVDELMFDRTFSLSASMARLELQTSFGERQGLFDAYGSYQSRDENGTTAAFELDSHGMTIGIPVEALGRSAIAFVNYHDTQLNIASGTHNIDAQSLRFGMSVPEIWAVEDYAIGMYALAGRNSYNGTRDVLVNQNTLTGITSVAASWDSTEIEFGVDASTSYALSPNLTLESNLGLAVQIERVERYAEQDYFTWSGRTIVQSHAKAEVNLDYQASVNTQLYGAVGLWRRDIQSGETANYTINNTDVNYNGGVSDETISTVRLGIGHELGNGGVLTAEAYGMDSRGADRTVGVSFGVAARF